MNAGAGPPELPPISIGPVNMSHKTEKLLICPYNKAHTILAYRMQTHLHKCRKQHAGGDWGYCSHNNTHHMPVAELEYHQTHACADRHAFQATFYTTEPAPPTLAPIDNIYVPEPSENWDDGVVNYFDPNKNAEEKSLIRGKHCVPPSERKAFRIQHRRAVNERMEEQRLLSTAHNRGDNKVEVKEKSNEEDDNMEPLRPPQALPRGFLPSGPKMNSERGLRSPGMVQDMAPLKSEPVGAYLEAAPKIQWSGMGRGRVARNYDEPSASTTLPYEPATSSFVPPGAWGMGRPKF